MEFNFSGSDNNVCFCGAQEGSPKDEGCLHVCQVLQNSLEQRSFLFLSKYSRRFLQDSEPIGWLVAAKSMLA
jgi:hypothetical protein